MKHTHDDPKIDCPACVEWIRKDPRKSTSYVPKIKKTNKTSYEKHYTERFCGSLF